MPEEQTAQLESNAEQPPAPPQAEAAPSLEELIASTMSSANRRHLFKARRNRSLKYRSPSRSRT